MNLSMVMFLRVEPKRLRFSRNLGDFVDYVQTVEKKGATIISFGRNDFESLTTLVELSEGLWGISEHFHDGVLYKAIKMYQEIEQQCKQLKKEYEEKVNKMGKRVLDTNK